MTGGRASATKAAIVDCSERLFIASGVDATTMDVIAAQLGLTKGAVYFHFANKTVLVDAVAGRAVARVLDAVDGGAALPEWAGEVVGRWRADRRIVELVPQLVGVDLARFVEPAVAPLVTGGPANSRLAATIIVAAAAMDGLAVAVPMLRAIAA